MPRIKQTRRLPEPPRRPRFTRATFPKSSGGGLVSDLAPDVKVDPKDVKDLESFLKDQKKTQKRATIKKKTKGKGGKGKAKKESSPPIVVVLSSSEEETIEKNRVADERKKILQGRRAVVKLTPLALQKFAHLIRVILSLSLSISQTHLALRVFFLGHDETRVLFAVRCLFVLKQQRFSLHFQTSMPMKKDKKKKRDKSPPHTMSSSDDERETSGKKTRSGHKYSARDESGSASEEGGGPADTTVGTEFTSGVAGDTTLLSGEGLGEFEVAQNPTSPTQLKFRRKVMINDWHCLNSCDERSSSL